MKRIVLGAMAILFVGAVSTVVIYYYNPNLLVRYSQSTILAYNAMLKAESGAEWEMRMRRGYKTDYAWLVDALNDMNDERHRFVSAWSLGVMGNKNAVSHLIDRLQNDPNFQVRYTSARALGALQARDAIPKLIEAISDVDTTVRNVAVDILGDLGAKEAIPAIEQAKITYQYPSMEYSADLALKKLK